MKKSQRYNGIFFPSSLKATGHVKLSNSKISASIVGDLYKIINEDYWDIDGKLPDGRRISLIECVKNGSMHFHDREDRAIETSLYPHFVVVGYDAISSTEQKITSIIYECENAYLFCENSKTFGTLYPSPEALNALFDTEYENSKELLADLDWAPIRREEAVGEHPIISYFDGNQEIATVDIPSGKLTIWNSVRYKFGSARGAKLKNTVFHTIEFNEPKTLREAVRDLIKIHQFYELLLGHKQKYKKIKLIFEGMDRGKHTPLSLFWNRCNQRVKESTRKVLPGDIPILASTERETFQKVLSNWMHASSSMNESRFRLFNGLLENRYSYDRLIGAANMYDLLPKDKVPEVEELSEELIKSVAASRQAFKDLDPSPARDSVLSALGRIGKPSLKTKILSRGAIVNKAMGMRFHKLDIVCHHAVLCRNHYVHGSAAGFEYDKNFPCFAFLTNTLEFVFSAADLIECGWNPKDYLSRHGTMSHFMGQYIIDYDHNIYLLDRVIA